VKNYWKLNNIVVPDAIPVAMIEEVLEKLQAVKFYAVLDSETMKQKSQFWFQIWIP